MRKIFSSFAALCFMLVALCSCNKNDEPPTEVTMPLTQSFLPTGVQFERSDTEFRDKLRDWTDKLFVVNSADELPADPLGFPEYYRSIDYSNTTLLLSYDLHFYKIESLVNKVTRNTIDKTYMWTLKMSVIDVVYEGDEIPETLFFSRFAVCLRKLPTDADIRVSFNISDLDPSSSPWFK